jgi:hypothetical protein
MMPEQVIVLEGDDPLTEKFREALGIADPAKIDCPVVSLISNLDEGKLKVACETDTHRVGIVFVVGASAVSYADVAKGWRETLILHQQKKKIAFQKFRQKFNSEGDYGDKISIDTIEPQEIINARTMFAKVKNLLRQFDKNYDFE